MDDFTLDPKLADTLLDRLPHNACEELEHALNNGVPLKEALGRLDSADLLVAYTGEENVIVQEALNAIRSTQTRRIVLMFYAEPKHTTRQIAQALNIPHDAVKITLRRFQRHFQRVLIRALDDLEQEALS